MFRYSLVLLAGLAAATPAGAASWADGMFEELSKDFCSVRGPALSHPFRLVNKTNNVVSIASVRVSCGCTTATALKTVLNPGEETAIVAQMNTLKFTGVKTVTIYVQFDRPAWEEVRLWVQANGRDDISVSPDTLAFGLTPRNTSPSTSVTITFMGDPRSQILEAQSDSNYVLTAVQEQQRDDSQVSYVLTATLRSDAPVGKWYTDVWLKTNNPSMQRVRVPLTVEIESALSVSPQAVAFGPVRVGAEAERKVVIRGVKSFKITGVRGSDADLLVRDSTTESKPVHVLTVTLKGGQPGDLSRTLRVITDLKEEAEIEFQAKAQIVP